MRHCCCFFLVLVLAAASAGSFVASQKTVSKEQDVLQTHSSRTGFGLKQLPDKSPEDQQLPVRRAGAAPHRRGARLRLRRRRRVDREARMGHKDPDNASERLSQASGEPRWERHEAGNEEDEANVEQAVELALRGKQVPRQGDAASAEASEKVANPTSDAVPSNAGIKDPASEDGQSGALARSAAARAESSSKDTKSDVSTGGSTLGTSTTGQKADPLPLKDIAKADPQPVEPEDSAAVLSAKSAAEQEAKPSLKDQMRTGAVGARQKSSEPLPHDGGGQEGSGDAADLDKEQFFPPLDTPPGDKPYDSTQSAIILANSRASGSEAGGGKQLASKVPGDKAVAGRARKDPRQQIGAGDSQTDLDEEQSREGAISSSDTGSEKRPRDKAAADKSAASGGHGAAGVKNAAKSGKVPDDGSKAGGAKSGSRAKGAKSGGSTSSDAKSGNGEAGFGERTGGGARADVAKSNKEPSGTVEGLREAIALLQRGDVGDGVFELADEVRCFTIWASRPSIAVHDVTYILIYASC